jgi:hypothetical protein
MMIQATSRMLKEEVTFDDKRINSLPPAPARG